MNLEKAKSFIEADYEYSEDQIGAEKILEVIYNTPFTSVKSVRGLLEQVSFEALEIAEVNVLELPTFEEDDSEYWDEEDNRNRRVPYYGNLLRNIHRRDSVLISAKGLLRKKRSTFI